MDATTNLLASSITLPANNQTIPTLMYPWISGASTKLNDIIEGQSVCSHCNSSKL